MRNRLIQSTAVALVATFGVASAICAGAQNPPAKASDDNVDPKATDAIAMTFRLGVDGALQHHQRHAARRGGRKSGGTTVKTVAMDRDVVVTKQALD